MIRFDFDGDQYKAASRHQKEWGGAMIAELPLAGNERILDLGCGDGVLTEQLAQRVPRGRVVGIDGSWGMIETAKKLEHENLYFILMDIEHLRFEYQFDLIFSNATLQWVKDHRKMLQRVALRLRPGGVVRFNFAGDGNCANLIAVVREVMADLSFAPWFRDFDWPWYMPGVGEYAKLIGQFDFQEIRVWDENADRYFEPDEMVRWVEQPCLVPFVSQLPTPARERFRDAVIDRILRRTRQADGRCFETFRRINVFARK